ncbi:uncharacterized protein ACA1_258280 [Acanthamoeba castellanii str. Neff]|uniref:Uncharacterized protein n=1 Tax=Acanthamoeba castellanii (strain ATCC 30010 / Neff) TaxID=1257118 RepID=L8GF33_ACACF|nr:uncharacterized protein ACA1_258280 [Acanthamoeba castellanii str. Neff]ELR11577.1 hypothetical protein ACA1_258280 [Acanthamoeba castellanii str. Neff]
METTRALLALLSVLVLLAFVAATTAAKSSTSFDASLLPGSDCPFCGNCSNHNTASRALIMKVNWTRHDYAWGFQGEVLKMYTGSNTQRAVGVPPQNTNSPPYIVAMVYAGEQPPVKFQPAGPDAPECFFIPLDQCQYFKLESLLTPAEQKILSQYS